MLASGNAQAEKKAREEREREPASLSNPTLNKIVASWYKQYLCSRLGIGPDPQTTFPELVWDPPDYSAPDLWGGGVV